MGAGDWVTGGLRRAVAGVVGARSGQAEDGEVESPAPAAAPGNGGQGRTAAAPAVPTTGATDAKAAAPKRTAAAPAPAKAPAKAPATGRTTARSTKPASTPAPAPAPEPAPTAAPPVGWTDEELAGFRIALDADIVRLREELDMGEADLAGLIEDSGDGSGDDQADAGSKTFEREHEMSVNANTREMLDQALRALRRLEAGTYGSCEACGGPIAAGRLRAFPRATLCIACKQAEERR